MIKQVYQARRKTMMDQAQKLINGGKHEEADAKMQEIEALDAQYQAQAKAQANHNALNGIHSTGGYMNAIGGGVDSFNRQGVVDEKTEYLKAWAKSMIGLQLNDAEREIFDNVNSTFRNITQTTAGHTVLVPETVAADIWKEAGELFPILGDIKTTFVPGDLTILQEADSGDDAAWYDEDTEVEDGDFDIGELNLTGCELAKAIPISWKLKKMSIEQFIPYITSLLAEKMGAALAKGIVSGKGKPGSGETFKPEPKGIVTAIEAEADTPQVVTYGGYGLDCLDYVMLTSALGKIKSTYKNGAAIYAKSATIWGQIATLADAIGNPLFIPDVTAGGVGRVFGLPVKEDDSIAEGDLLIGNVNRGYAVNVNENMTIYTEDHIKKRRTDYMSYSIVDGDVKTTKAFAYIKKAS